MKKLFIVILVLIALLGAGGYALTRFISVKDVQDKIVAKVKEQTGRDIAFDAMHPAFFFPNIGLRVRNVTFSNASWAHDKTMLELEELDLHLALQPLFHRQVEIAKLTLKKPVIHLETAADGRTNWNFTKPGQAEKPAGKEGGGSPAGDAASGFGFKFGQMQIVGGGTVTFRDGKKGSVTKVDNVNLSLTYPDFTSPLAMDGEFNYRDKRINVLVNLTKPLDFIHGKTSEGDMQVNGKDLFSIRLSGNLSTTGTLFAGRIAEISTASLSDVAGWLEGGKTKLPFEKFSFASNASATAGGLKLTGAKLKLDDMDAAGDVTVGLGARPNVTAKLSLDHIDLDKFTEASKETAAQKGTKATAAAASQDWDATPMDFGGLKTFDADVTLQTKGFAVKGAEVGPSTLTALLNNGSLHAKSSEATLFNGTFSSDLTVNAASAPPNLAFKFNMSDVQAKPMLTAFANFKKLDGKAFASADVTSSGNSQKSIVSNLAGHGTFDFKNGSLEGIDLVKFAKIIQNRLGEMNIGEGKTEFVDMGGTYAVTKGVAHNEDLKMKGPLVQATGSGDIDLPAKYIKYRMLPVLTASSGVENAKGLTIPVDITGPFSSVKAKPDYKSVLKNVLDNPEDTKAVIKNVREQGKDILKNLRSDPNKALNQLLGIPAPQAAPAPEASPMPEAAPAPGATQPEAQPAPAAP